MNLTINKPRPSKQLQEVRSHQKLPKRHPQWAQLAQPPTQMKSGSQHQQEANLWSLILPADGTPRGPETPRPVPTSHLGCQMHGRPLRSPSWGPTNRYEKSFFSKEWMSQSTSHLSDFHDHPKTKMPTPPGSCTTAPPRRTSCAPLTQARILHTVP